MYQAILQVAFIETGIVICEASKMDAKQLFFERYNGFREYPEILLKGMTEQQIRQTPHSAVNPIAWLLWHMARCEDMAVNRLLFDLAPGN